MTLKVLAGRLRLPEPPAAYFDGMIRDAPFEVLAIEQRHVNLLHESPRSTTIPSTGCSWRKRWPTISIW